MGKPLCIRLEETASAIEQIAIKSELPCYLLLPIFEKITHKLENGKRSELETAQQMLENAQKEEAQ